MPGPTGTPMTEAEWLTCTDAPQALTLYKPRASARKLRLYACARCRARPALMAGELSRLAVETSEQFADELISEDALKKAIRAARIENHQRNREVGDEHGLVVSSADETLLAFATGVHCSTLRFYLHRSFVRLEPATELFLLRDIFGNPFRPLALDPAWRTFNVVALARGMYESRDFSAMPILADALQDAGCEDEEILGHCRGPGPHVRGCWPVDLILAHEAG